MPSTKNSRILRLIQSTLLPRLNRSTFLAVAGPHLRPHADRRPAPFGGRMNGLSRVSIVAACLVAPVVFGQTQTPKNVVAVLDHYEVKAARTTCGNNSVENPPVNQPDGVLTLSRTCTGSSGTMTATIIAPARMTGHEVPDQNRPGYAFDAPPLVKATVVAKFTAASGDGYSIVTIPFEDTFQFTGVGSGGKCDDRAGTVKQTFKDSATITSTDDCERNPNFSSSFVYTDTGTPMFYIETRGGAAFVGTGEGTGFGFEIRAWYRVEPAGAQSYQFITPPGLSSGGVSDPVGIRLDANCGTVYVPSCPPGAFPFHVYDQAGYIVLTAPASAPGTMLPSGDIQLGAANFTGAATGTTGGSAFSVQVSNQGDPGGACTGGGLSFQCATNGLVSVKIGSPSVNAVRLNMNIAITIMY